MKSLIYLLFFSTFTGCMAIGSTLNYTLGSQCLIDKEYNEAVVYLERAVELDPDMGKNHQNLAMAYLQLADYDKAWIHLRKALQCKYPDAYAARKTFPSFYQCYVTNQGIDELGTSRDAITTQLGEPDMILAHGNQYVYGLCIMTFEDDKLAHVGFFY